MSITLYDAVMLGIVIVAVVQGAWRGMAWQVAPIASLVLGYVVAFPLSAKLAPYFGQPPTNRLFAMICIYITVSLAVYMMVRSLRESLEKMKLVEFDKHLGAILGGVKGVLFTVAVTIGLLTVSPQARGIILPSETRTLSARLMTSISPILPPALNDILRPYVQKLNEQPDGSVAPSAFGRDSLQLQPLSSTAHRQNLAKPKRFDDNDGYVPPARHDELPAFGAPQEPDLQPLPRPTARQAQPMPSAEPDDFFNADPNRAISSPPRRSVVR